MKKLFIIGLITGFGFNGYSQNIVQLKSGEKMNGQVKSLNNGMVEFLYKGTLKKINVSEIYSINFGETGESIVGESKSTIQHEPGEKQVNSGSYMVRYKVADRTISKPPKIDNLTQEKGTVVVEVAPGYKPKIGHALSLYGFKGTVIIIESDLEAAAYIEQLYQIDFAPYKLLLNYYSFLQFQFHHTILLKYLVPQNNKTVPSHSCFV